MNTGDKVFLLYEIQTAGFSSNSEVVDVFNNWKDAEDARVGLNSQREHGFVEYSVVEWSVR